MPAQGVMQYMPPLPVEMNKQLLEVVLARSGGALGGGGGAALGGAPPAGASLTSPSGPGAPHRSIEVMSMHGVLVFTPSPVKHGR